MRGMSAALAAIMPNDIRLAPLCALAPLLVSLAVGCSSAPTADEDVAATSDSEAVSGQSIASIALANVGRGACSQNTQGGYAYASSCTGNGGQPEYWCADFARWVWGAAGANTSGLDAAAGSFYVYGQDHGTLHSTPSVGDAVVFNYKGGGVADHVAIVTKVYSNGEIESVSGDWGGQSGSEAHFSSTSHVDVNSEYSPGIGSVPAHIGMKISGFISPIGTPGSPPPKVAKCSQGPGYCTATEQCEDGHWVNRYSDPHACTSGPGA